MKKLTSWLKWLDANLIHISIIAFIILAALLPKIPLRHVEYTYIRIRLDDILPVVVSLIFLVQWVRGKIRLNTKFLLPVTLFWGAVFLSFIVGAFIQNTVVVTNIGLMHSVRRLQYMAIFFIASSAVTSEKSFRSYMRLYLITALVVALYGLGQRFLSFPSIQSMNPAYVDGRLLFLNPEDRINSTFGGQFDLAAYLTFSMPILLGFYFAERRMRYLVTFLFSLLALLYTAARSSFGAYFLTIHGFLLVTKKYRMALAVFIITVILTLLTGVMIKRITSTLQVKTVYVNNQTKVEQIDQKITTKNLPAGGLKVAQLKNTAPASLEEIRLAALREAILEASQSGKVYNTEEVNKRAAEIAKYIKPQKTLLCDISCATRLQLEWPRAVGAFLFNPIVGTGPSSITEATDNDLLRWLGETGIVGTALFIFLLASIARFVWQTSRKVNPKDKLIYTSFIWGLLALFINGMYIDVFEASKVAYNFWLVAGLYVGVGTILAKSAKKGK